MKILEVKPGAIIDALDTMYPTRMLVAGDYHIQTDQTRTTYGYVLRGNATLNVDENPMELSRGFYFCVPGVFTLKTYGVAHVVLIERLGFRGMLNVGMTEKKGRLSYIDGCSDSLLVAPPRMGDPCFNFLHFPVGINQTQHTHPSIRMGIVAEGRGVAYQAKGAHGDGWEEPLIEGKMFMLEEQELHSFRTVDLFAYDQTASGERTDQRLALPNSHMNIIAYHPDSDWGATDQLHPMLNRTYIGSTPVPGGQYTAT
jgi:hypothetical protein